jgi:hypothetical protein
MDPRNDNGDERPDLGLVTAIIGLTLVATFALVSLGAI